MASLEFNPSLVKEGQNIESAIRSAKDQAEEFTAESIPAFYVIPCDGFDMVYLEKDLSMARFVYLFTDDRIYDMQLDEEYGFFCTGVPHGTVADNAVLYYEDYAGNTYYSDVGAQYACSFIAGSGSFTYTDGAKYNSGDKEYIFTTTIKDNCFNAVNMQLFDFMTGKYLRSVETAQVPGTFRGSFIQVNETGYYTIKLNGTANTQDEGIAVLAYLEKGQKYYYTFDVDEFSGKRIKIKNCEIFGPSPYRTGIKELAVNVEKSEGTAAAKGNRFTMTTEVEGNVFNSVILQLTNTETREVLDAISIVREAGKNTEQYLHTAESGSYFLKLRANSKLKDEYVGIYVDLQKGNLYEWSYNVESITEKKVSISDFSFKSYGTPFE